MRIQGLTLGPKLKVRDRVDSGVVAPPAVNVRDELGGKTVDLEVGSSRGRDPSRPISEDDLVVNHELSELLPEVAERGLVDKNTCWLVSDRNVRDKRGSTYKICLGT